MTTRPALTLFLDRHPELDSSETEEALLKSLQKSLISLLDSIGEKLLNKSPKPLTFNIEWVATRLLQLWKFQDPKQVAAAANMVNGSLAKTRKKIERAKAEKRFWETKAKLIRISAAR